MGRTRGSPAPSAAPDPSPSAQELPESTGSERPGRCARHPAPTAATYPLAMPIPHLHSMLEFVPFLLILVFIYTQQPDPDSKSV